MIQTKSPYKDILEKIHELAKRPTGFTVHDMPEIDSPRLNNCLRILKKMDLVFGQREMGRNFSRFFASKGDLETYFGNFTSTKTKTVKDAKTVLKFEDGVEIVYPENFKFTKHQSPVDYKPLDALPKWKIREGSTAFLDVKSKGIG